jgi:hypothetical protein
MEHIPTCRDFADIKVRYEGYGFTLDYEGSDDEYWKEFESMLKMFSEKVIKSYREFKNFNLDSYYENCFDAMIRDFKLQKCPYKRVVTATNTYGSLYLDGKLLGKVSSMEVIE